MPENLILEHLKHIRSRVDGIDERLSRVEINVSSIGRQLGELTSLYFAGLGDIESLRRRVERIERRLEISDT